MDLKRKIIAQSENEGNAEKKLKILENVTASFGCRQGEREEMQDFHVLTRKFDLGKGFLHRCSFFAIFDGHAGSRAARFCQQKMEPEIRQRLEKYENLGDMQKSMKNVFVEAFKKVDEEFCGKARAEKPAWKDGTTATTMLLLNETLYVANIGDTRAIVARRKIAASQLTAIPLTVDHNPMLHAERMRIQAQGGCVKDGRVNGVIEVSRSIGDLAFKNAGVTSVPDLKKLTLTKDDLFAVIACDGLWKSFSNQEVIDFVQEKLENLKSLDLELQPNETREEAEIRQISDSLAAEAVRRKCGDNVSIIIIKF